MSEALRVDVRHDLRRLELELGLYPQEKMSAAVRALNRTITTQRKEGAQLMARELPGVKIGVIKAQMKMIRASRTVPRAALTFSPKRLRLTNFGARQTAGGVSLRGLWAIVTPDGTKIPAGVLRHAFIQAAKSNNPRRFQNVWIRLNRERYPIEVLLAPSLAEAFVQRGLGAQLMQSGYARFRVVLEQEAKYRLGKRGA